LRLAEGADERSLQHVVEQFGAEDGKRGVGEEAEAM
jgi:hypothetical protein